MWLQKMKSVEIEFGAGFLTVNVPQSADLLSLPSAQVLRDAPSELAHGLKHPLGSAPLGDIVRIRKMTCADPRAVIVVSDQTRPVPYAGANGILEPILDSLRQAGVHAITILVANGTHRSLSNAELRALLPNGAFAEDVAIVNHDCANRRFLRRLGRTRRGTEVWVNALYLDADIKILTGLVEPHFMAGFSGGRKAICPGLIGMEATHIFHGAAMMADPRADSLILEGNPCHEEALEVARMAGCDFIVNVTIDRHKRITGIFCGAMEAAHLAACARARDTNAIAIKRKYDIVITHAGFAGINHYQAAKAACEAVKAARRGGGVMLVANHTDTHPVGSSGYRQVLRMLTELGPDEFNRKISASDWVFMPEQWEAQKWAQCLAVLGDMRNLVYCAPRLTGRAFAEHGVPGIDGGIGLPPAEERQLAAAMLQRSLDARLRVAPDAGVAVLLDGPYGVPAPEN